MTLISVKNLSVLYDDTQAIQDVSFDIQQGDYTAIIGPNGAGKSTIIKAIVGLVNPQRGGEVRVEGGIGRLGYVPRYNAVDWTFPVSVRDVVMMGLTRQVWDMVKKNSKSIANITVFACRCFTKQPTLIMIQSRH